MDVTDASRIEEDAFSGEDTIDAVRCSHSVVNRNVAFSSGDRNSAYYNMSHKKRGMAIIFNHEYFDNPKLQPRHGTNADCDNLKHTLQDLGFEVAVHNNLKSKEIMKVLEEAAQINHSDCDCFVLAVLSHGEEGAVYARDAPYKPDFLWTPFTADKCGTLAGKPKLFFLQASQGDKLDGGTRIESKYEVDGDYTWYTIPTHADFLIAYSTIPGFCSWRNTTNGSGFVQALCSELQDKGTSVDIHTLLTFVIKRVAIDFESNVPGDQRMHQQKQLPCVNTMLTRLLRFTRNSVVNRNVAFSSGDRNSAYYNMSHKKRGMAIIFNHEYFDNPKLRPRHGTNADCDNLKHTLQDLGFEVAVHNNLKSKEIMKVLEEAAQIDHSDCDCFVLAVLSHGEEGAIYARDAPYKPDFLWTPFTADKCGTLAGKPKLFFLEGLQGDKLHGGTRIESKYEVDGDYTWYTIPTHADFLIAYSTIPGFYSWRNSTDGSWFVQALCSELQDKGTSIDIHTLLTFVIQRVALDFESNVPGKQRMHQQKQLPCVNTMLTRLLRFTRK